LSTTKKGIEIALDTLKSFFVNSASYTRRRVIIFSTEVLQCSSSWGLINLVSRRRKPEIDAADAAERLVGITPIYLQNFVSRGLYGLRASVIPGKVRAQRRLFSQEDIFGIALVWLLFEAGLRSEPITRVLNDIAGTKKANANLAAKKLLESQADYLVIIRSARTPTKTLQEKPGQIVKTSCQLELVAAIEQSPSADVLVIPVGAKFQDVSKRLQILFGA